MCGFPSESAHHIQCRACKGVSNYCTVTILFEKCEDNFTADIKAQLLYTPQTEFGEKL